MIRNIKLVFAYDGSAYSGMQSQGLNNSVQEELELAIFKITGRSSRLITAGRTDAGVHAIGQVANFLTVADIPGYAYKYHFQKYLSDSIIVTDSSEEDLNFHSRFSAKSKTYRYILYTGEFMHPSFNKSYTHISYKLDLSKMKEASKYLLGRHDFRAFTKYESTSKNTIRSIDQIEIYQDGLKVVIEFKAESFLYNQVRIMVGSLIDVGRGHRDPIYMKELIDSKDRLKAGKTYSPSGLYLVKIDY